MKKIFLSSIALFVFAIAIIIFQMSCRKTAVAQSGTNSISPLGIVLLEGQDTTVGGRETYYTVNYDGSNLKQINISSFPLGDQMIEGTGRLSPDGKTLFFIGNTPSGSYLYSINTDGTNLKQLVGRPSSPAEFDFLDGAY